MKALYTLGFISVLLLSACTTTYNTHVYPDDVYYSSRNNEPSSNEIIMEEPSNVNPEPDYSTSEIIEDENGDTYVTNNYYEGDNYRFYNEDDNDYYYTSRIRRFHRPYSGFSYWGSCYTDYYWYTYNPSYYGVSIYVGWGQPWYSRPYYWHRPYYSHCGWYHPYYSYNYYSPYYPSYYYSYNPYSWGYNPYGWGYNPYGWGYNPYYGYGGYYSGYSGHGYYGHGNNDYGYSSTYDPTDYYYGHRGSTASNTGVTSDRSNIEFGKTGNTVAGNQDAYTGRKDSKEKEIGMNQANNADSRDLAVKNNDDKEVTPEKGARTLIDKEAKDRDVKSMGFGENMDDNKSNTNTGRNPVENKVSKGTDVRTSPRTYQPYQKEERKNVGVSKTYSNTNTYKQPVRNYSTPDRSGREFERTQPKQENKPERNYNPGKSYEYKSEPSRNNDRQEIKKPENNYQYNYREPEQKQENNYQRSEPKKSDNQNNYSQPERKQEPAKNNSTPQRNYEKPKSYSAPSRESSPSKSYSAPSQKSSSKNSYSAPSRSNNSSSKSSNSGSNSGSSRSNTSSSKSSGSSSSGSNRRK